MQRLSRLSISCSIQYNKSNKRKNKGKITIELVYYRTRYVDTQAYLINYKFIYQMSMQVETYCYVIFINNTKFHNYLGTLRHLLNGAICVYVSADKQHRNLTNSGGYAYHIPSIWRVRP